MSEYDILLTPTRVAEQWYEVPKIVSCGVNKQQVKTWEDVTECVQQFGYTKLTNGTLLTKRIKENTKLEVDINPKTCAIRSIKGKHKLIIINK